MQKLVSVNLLLQWHFMRCALVEYRYQEHSQLQIPKALPPVAEALSINTAGVLAQQSNGPAVSDKEWKTLLGKLVRVSS